MASQSPRSRDETGTEGLRFALAAAKNASVLSDEWHLDFRKLFPEFNFGRSCELPETRLLK
jgi:hypothetical protein